MVWGMVMMMPGVVMLVPLRAAGCRRRTPPIYAVGIKYVFILDALWLSTLLRVDSLQPQNVSRLGVVGERVLSIVG